MGTAAAVIGVIGTAVSIEEQRRAASQQRKAERLGQRRADIETARARRQQIRQARIRRAQIISQAQAAGGAGAAAEAGAIGGLQQQLGVNLGFLGQQQEISRGISRARIGAAEAQTRAGVAGGIAGFAIQQAGPAGFTELGRRARSIFQTRPGPTSLPPLPAGPR